MPFILAKKLKMSQIWNEANVVPVTVFSVPENKVTLLRTKEKDGYTATQLSAGKIIREFRTKGESTQTKGETISISLFKEGEKVRVSANSKGRGFQGVVKRHGFHGGPKTHGQKNRLRAPGSIGSTAPQRVTPGRRMAGHMGNERVTIKNLIIAKIDTEKNLILLRGAVPGNRGTIVEIETL